MTCRPTCIQPSPSNAHCGACHHTFSGVSSFDRHRRAGECLSPLVIGLRADHKGIWRYPAPDPTQRTAWSQRDAEQRCVWCHRLGHAADAHPLPKDHPQYDAFYDASDDELAVIVSEAIAPGRHQ